MDVSIVITAYNYAGYLTECISSCLNQEDAGLSYEVLVIDDGSTDETPALLANWESERLRKFRINNSGIEVASNFGFANARGNYLLRVDADDLLLPDYLREMRSHIKARWSFIYSDYQVIDADGRCVETVCLPEFEPAEIYSRGDFLATGTLYRREVLEAVGGYEIKVRNSGLENYELILRLLRAGHIGKHVKRNIFSYRRHSENISITKKGQIIKNGKILFARFSLGAYRTNEFHPYKLKVSL
jgi:glycosyltransferase involved in cell wall biosynthesis